MKPNRDHLSPQADKAVQLPRFYNTPLELSMAQWMQTRRRWDACIAKRSKLGRTLAPRDMEAFNAFLRTTKEVVLDTKSKCHITQPAKVSAAVLKHSVVVELKMSLEPQHLAVRFNNGTWCHLFVKEFTVEDAPDCAPNLDAEISPERACMPEEMDEAPEGELSDNESEFEEVNEEMAAACAAFMHGSCHENDGTD